MKKITIEFFHDVICSFCFPMSYQMRKIAKKYPDVEIIHRSFALVKEPIDFTAMFGSREEAKKEILHHWAAANRIDELHRFQIEGMEKRDFLFPISMPALYACKAAYFMGGQELYWDVFDALQSAFFEKNQNVEEESIIVESLEAVGIDLEKWNEHYRSQEVKDEVEKDLELALKYQVQVVPTLVIGKTGFISGAESYENIVKAIERAREAL